jgi:hypothetical protein
VRDEQFFGLGTGGHDEIEGWLARVPGAAALGQRRLLGIARCAPEGWLFLAVDRHPQEGAVFWSRIGPEGGPVAPVLVSPGVFRLIAGLAWPAGRAPGAAPRRKSRPDRR